MKGRRVRGRARPGQWAGPAGAAALRGLRAPRAGAAARGPAPLVPRAGAVLAGRRPPSGGRLSGALGVRTAQSRVGAGGSAAAAPRSRCTLERRLQVRGGEAMCQHGAGQAEAAGAAAGVAQSGGQMILGFLQPREENAFSKICL